MADELKDVETKEEETFEVDVDEEKETESNEEITTEETEEKTKQETEEEEKEEEKMVPLRALEAERKKWKERLNDPEIQKAKAIADRLKQTTGKDYDAIQQELDQMQINQYTEHGMDPVMAQQLVQQQRQMAEIQKRLNKQQRDAEIAALKQEPFFSDIEYYRDEVEDLADRTGLSVKQAYLALRGDVRQVEYQREIEQRVLNNRSKKQKAKIDTTPSGETKVKTSVKLTDVEKEIADAAGISYAEYARLKSKGYQLSQHRNSKKKK